ncbi:MAG: methanogen output domain 1-containing protein [Anaerolineaceae bacterium]|nr:methanogen output domain 1-containing protein [Anaerolineaceae bacterium]
MKSTRERILHQLLSQPFSSINDLAKAVGINAISVRHHLTSLQAEGSVAAQEERHGVGRPRLVYFLTENGREKFPARYLQLTNRLLDQLKMTLPKESVEKLFHQMASNLTEKGSEKVKNLPMEEKIEALMEFMEDDGFSSAWEVVGDEYHIHQISCPYIHASQNHPELCTLGQMIVSMYLSVSTEMISCMVEGNAHCTFKIPKTASEM